MHPLPADPGPPVSRRLILYSDGAARGNPGPAGIGAVLYEERPEGRVRLGELSHAIGRATNNEAEYRALLAGLEMAERLGAEELVVRADSELLVRQLLGEYRVKAPGLVDLHREAGERLGRFGGVRIEHVPRQENTQADALANQALDALEERG